MTSTFSTRLTERTSRLVERASAAVESKTTRRGFIQKTAFVGSAVAVAPLRYALRPGTAYAAICNCSGQSCDCGSRCCDGYTEFCCTITGENRCPPGTIVAGWWKADGSGFCDVNGVSQPRYYMDCNADCHGCGCGGNGICSQTCTDCACGCANGDCGNRKTCCTSFRYGQCNQHVECVGQIVCRVVTCTPPWELEPTCTRTVLTDNATRFHDAPCLHEPVHIPLHPEGAILKTAANPLVWIVQDGVRWPVVIEDALRSRASISEIAVVPQRALDPFPTAQAAFRDGSILRTPDGRVFVVSDGRRRHVASEEVFNGLGLQPGGIRNVRAEVAAGTPEGSAVTDASTVPDGLFVTRPADPTVYRVVDSQLRPILTASVFASYRVGQQEVARLSEQQGASLPVGPPLGFRDGTLIWHDNRVWAISDGARRWITTGEVFAALGYDARNVVAATRDEALLHPEGAPVDRPVHPNGAFVKTPAYPTVWVVERGIRRPFQSAEAFESRASFGEVASVPADRLAPLPIMAMGWRDGSLLRTPDGRIFVISRHERRHITSESVFNQLGLSFDAVRHVSAADAAVHPEGAPVDSGAQPVDGMFVRVPGRPHIYRVADGRARRIVSAEAFDSYRAGIHEVARLSEAQLPPAGDDLGFRDGSLIQTPDGRVWAIADGRRRWVSSPEVLRALGYDGSDVVPVSDEVAAVHPEGDPLI